MLEALKDIWTRLVWGEKFTSIHVHLLDNEEAQFSAITIERKADDLSILDQLSTLSSIDGLKDFADDMIPLAIVITGKGVISKRLPRNVGGEEAQIREYLREYGNTEVTHTVTLNENWLYINIMRSDLVNTWLTKFQKAGVHPVRIELGPSTGWEILQFLDGREVETGQYKFEFDGHGLGIIEESGSEPGSYLLDGDSLSGQLLLPYAGVVSLLRNLDSGSDDGLLNQKFQTSYYERATKKAGLVSVAVLFVVLLINAGLFMHYHEKQSTLEGQLLEYQGKLSEVELLQTELEQKRLMARASGNNTHGRFAYYADQVAAVLNGNIRLTRLTVNPIQPKEARSNKITVRSNVLEVEGLCKESSELDDWITKLNGLEDVSSVRILDFGKKRDSDENAFSIEITMKG